MSELIDITQHTGLLYLQAQHYVRLGVPLKDLLQVGYVGLMKAANRFDSDLGYKFMTYGKFASRREMNRLAIKCINNANRYPSLEALCDEARQFDDEPTEAEELPANLDLPIEETPFTVLDAKEHMDRARKALSCLSEREYEFIRLHFFDGKSYAKIAIAKGCFPSYPRKVIHKALAKLRQHLEAA